MPKLLLVDDDVELCRMLTEYLEGEGFAVDSVHTGRAALAQAQSGDYDALVLDVMLPELSGFDVLRELRKTDATPVLMLTARGEDVDTVVGLELGADDYLPKPCNPRVLVARLRALLRRIGSGDGREASVLHIGDVYLDIGRRYVAVAEQPVTLTGTEFSLLELLLREAGTVVSKETISQQCLGRPLLPYDRSIDMHISHLRRKLGPLPDGTARITTVRGVGYQYLAAADA
ncbi:DNA-binding response regulator [Alkalilimnicola ehrlichii]|uniref:DNA-binding response regulator n=1 Tax=Alkalilimnicola ehrlichii TaxID=351052 RepID=A0A3E0WLW6_9GAMM|nr:response regulator transcription factor [Alkalilimnicola ehrlichii]RFA25866.1 DNA-binding response regulator [Alkalilimnicola ehrlichii]RFA33077.1 DNA-binding response regulator [Alkalilimnicola ehrlichii]